MHNKKTKKINFSVSQFLSFSAGESGMTLALSLIIVSNILMIALAMGIFSLNQLKMTISAKESAYAIFAATSGLERAFYQARINNICGNISETILSPDLKYFVDITSLTCPNDAIITSTGSYRKTSRKIEANW